MMRYSVQPRDRIFVNGYGFMSFAKNMGKNTSKNISKKVSGKYSKKHLHHAKQSEADGLKTTSKKRFKKQRKRLVIWLVTKLLIIL